VGGPDKIDLPGRHVAHFKERKQIRQHPPERCLTACLRASRCLGSGIGCLRRYRHS
jgi:hypothetical protein